MLNHRWHALVALTSSVMLVSACAPASRQGLPTSPVTIGASDSGVRDLGALMTSTLPTGTVRLSLGLKDPARSVQSFPATVKEFRLTVTDEASPSTFPVLTKNFPHGSATATESVQFNVPVASCTVAVDALNSYGDVIGHAEQASVSITAGAYTPLTLTLVSLTGNVTGKLLDADTGAACVGADVAIGELHATTDASGSYEIDDILPGVKTITFNQPLVGDASHSVAILAGVTNAVGVDTLTTQHWFPLFPGTTSRLLGVQALSANEAIVWGEGATVLRTADGGASWTPITLPGNAVAVNSIRFANATAGWALTAAGHLYRSTDGGQSWNAMSLLTDDGDALSTGYGIALFGANEASFFGATGSVKVTGYTATASTPSIVVTSKVIGTSISAIATSSVLTIDKGSSTILSSFDFGNAWGQSTITGLTTDADFAPNAILARSLSEAYVVGHDDAGYPVVMRSTTGGANWTTLYTSTTHLSNSWGFRSIATVGADGLCAVGANGTIAMRKPATTTWRVSTAQSANAAAMMLNDVAFFDATHGWAVGDDGLILKY